MNRAEILAEFKTWRAKSAAQFERFEALLLNADPERAPARLVAAIFAVLETEWFTSAEIRRLADAHPSPELKDALAGCGVSNPRQIGKFLSSIREKDIEGLTVITGGDQAAGKQWQIQRR
ncbi:hypothetical protein [Mesorhizobium sp. M0187]|uniref:hypothetical protein n=1 Tax=Mesorhizobium sp. M0187 TaxID=2956908 RepID=UPI00333E00E8